MGNHDDALEALREAVRLSPSNIPLREHLAQLLMGQGQPEEAERELRAALGQAPSNARVKLGLASAFYQPADLEKDPTDQYQWRFPVRRLEAEIIRDTILDAGGSLNPEAGGPALPSIANRHAGGEHGRR